MKRDDLRRYKTKFLEEMRNILDNSLNSGEIAIFIFEVGDFGTVQKSSDFVKKRGDEMMNSLRYNEVDWTVVVKKR